MVIDKVIMDICIVWCLCIVGIGECCNYVIVIFYKLEYVVFNLFIDLVCIFMLCGWNKGIRKSVVVVRIFDFRIRKDERIGEIKKDNIISNDLINFDFCRELYRLVCDEEKE